MKAAIIAVTFAVTFGACQPPVHIRPKQPARPQCINVPCVGLPIGPGQ